jgi:cell division protein FtsQ
VSSITGNNGRAAQAANAPGRDTFSGAFVLPRFLRRPVRYAAALATGRVGIRPHAGSVAAVAFFAATGLYGMALGGHTQAVTQAVTTGAGFALEDVHVSGNVETRVVTLIRGIAFEILSSALL